MKKDFWNKCFLLVVIFLSLKKLLRLPEPKEMEDDGVNHSVGQGILLVQQNPKKDNLIKKIGLRESMSKGLNDQKFDFAFSKKCSLLGDF